MGLTYSYTAPPHTKNQLTSVSALTQTTEKSSERDPHSLPSFGPDTLTHPPAPILYLPPLLSSLPQEYHPEPIPSDRPPVITETRLPNIDPVSLSLHKALHNFRPLHADYAHRPYVEAFNWSELLLPEDEEREWYCVAFRSKRKAGSESGPLYEADKLAHEEAIRNGGLIMYWYGSPDEVTGLNLATCVWQSRRHAIAAIAQPHHKKGMKLASGSYETYTLERHIIRKEKGTSSLKIVPYTTGEVGW